jgi:hypothetical protein
MDIKCTDKDINMITVDQCFGSGSGWIRIQSGLHLESGSGLKLGLKSENLLGVTLSRQEQKNIPTKLKFQLQFSRTFLGTFDSWLFFKISHH